MSALGGGSALGRVVRAGIGRRRVQTAVMVLTTLMAVTASVLATGLLVAARAPFDHAFAEQHGAHLTARFDGTKVTATQLAATASTSGVTAAAGPFRSLSLRPRTASRSDALPSGVDLPPLTVVGRADGAGRVDGVTLVTGSWATRPGQIVVAYSGLPVQPGARLRFPAAPGSPTMTVVGVARSVTGTADAWVTPAQAGALTAKGSPPTYEMLYRFRHAGTDAQLAADRAAIAAAVPRGALTGSGSYLTVRQQQTANTMAFVPFLAAFGVLGLLLSVLVIGIVVSGAVGAATRRIGILKSLGFTPAQVVRSYVGQALIPAAAGCALGLVLGNLLALPVLGDVGRAFDGPSASIPVWIDAVVPAAALALVAGAALVPALRAGRLRTVEAITVGRTPGAGRGRLVRRLTGRLPLPRAVGLGLGNPFARPARSATTAAAVAFGAATVTFGVGLALTLGAVQSGRMLDSAGSVVVEAGGGQAPPGAEAVHAGGGPGAPQADPAAVDAALRAQHGTRRFYGTAQAQVDASGITGATDVVAYRGDASWAAPQMVSGRWLDGPGQAVVTTRFLHAAGIRVGDTVTLTEQGRKTSVRIVGEAFFTAGQGMELLTRTSTLAALGLDAKPGRYTVQTRPGTDLTRYLTSLNAALDPVGAMAQANTTETSDVIVTMDALVGMLTLMLVAVAGLGVLNTVVLDTRDRVHDLGVLKALGMAPRQAMTMVVTSVAVIGLPAGAAAVPVGVALHRYITPLMGKAVGMTLPTPDIAVYHAPLLALLGLGGLLIAITGALLPAGWAARKDTASALRSE
ncbi:ABC transporter permease [Streptomyces guryensis]|uniref:ABC transporter permease n=1 Tax=Streptomyces guryensis TaxID=2886947 RepID=A0A9Q3ZAW0_9ACTN|nr:ABC transporter permease [Streptomyces guryensis]MCD9875730.1 ABC transporter permease [Streptomyces guryensis]